VLDDFEELSGWTAIASEGTRVSITHEPGQNGMAMRIAFELNTGGGWAIVRKSFSLALPANYAFNFQLRGEGRPNNFEFKLVDAKGRNVWWRNQRDMVFPREWQGMTIRKSRLEYAWGPGSGAELKQVGAIEFAISGGEGGSGSVWLDDLTFAEREPAAHDPVTPEVQASSALPGFEPAFVLDQDPQTRWRSEPLPREQSVTLDFVRNHEYGGLVIDWDRDDYATAFEVETSSDGERWASAYRTTTGHGGRDYVYMPDAESRFVRIELTRSSRGRGYGIATIVVKPFEFSASPDRFFEAIARDSAPGTYPKYFTGRQTYWTIVGVDGDDHEALLNEEGLLEVDKGAFSIEPFLYTDAGLVTWSTVATEQQLDHGYMPIPSVVWQHERLRLTTTAFAAGESGRSTLFARYVIENHSDHGEPVQLFLAVRPFQVNPPWQTLNTTGGVTHIQDMRFDGRTVWVNRDRPVVSLVSPDRFGAATFEEGSITEFLADGKVPPHEQASDPFGFASGALQYNFYLAPNARGEVDLAIPFQHSPTTATAPLADAGSTLLAQQLQETRRYWERVLNRVEITLPADAQRVTDTLRTNLAYILINRDGPAIRPGSRNYARSWIRDGAITSSALLEMGFTQEVRDFLRWYAGYQEPDGKIPCCVDRRGADPVPEHDGPGAFITAVAEYYRYTHDIGFLNDMWPHVVRATDYLGALRRRRMTDEYRTPEKQAFYGLLPESISHEGYAAHPVHSYWDDFFALRGLEDAADLAVVVGDDQHAEKLAALRDGFHETLSASIARTVAHHGIDYLPGSVELGDFDPTSTAIALMPGGNLDGLPEDTVRRTWDRYYAEFDKRRTGADWEEYSPYEMRNVGPLVWLGQRERALEVLDWFLADRRPAGWNEWAEIAWRDASAPRFIGDMPHGWVGAGFIRAVRTLLAYERESDRALVLAAGVPARWVMSDTGVGVKRLPTHYGVVGYQMRGESADAVRVRISGDVATVKIVVRSPLTRPIRAVKVNGQPVDTFTADAATVAALPADVLLEY